MIARAFVTNLLAGCVLFSLACQDSRKRRATREQSVAANADPASLATGLDEDAFVSGVNYGLIMQHESEITSTFALLMLLEDEDSDRARDANRFLKLRLDGALLALYYLRDLVKAEHYLIGIANHVKAADLRAFMQKLKAERSAKGWASDDPDMEKKISEVIEIYCRDGALLRRDAQPSDGSDAATPSEGGASEVEY